MKTVAVGLATVGLLVGCATARADTILAVVTPQNIKEGTFRLTSKAARNNTVEFVIRRDVRNINGPGRASYVSNPEVDGKSLGTPVKLEEDGKTFIYRFSVPAEKVAGSLFTLWGGGEVGEGVTYRFRLGEFWKPKKN